MTVLPTDCQSTVMATCTTVSSSVTGLVGKICEDTTAKLNTALDASCQKIGASGGGSRRLLSHGTNMQSGSLVVESLTIDSAAAMTTINEALTKVMADGKAAFEQAFKDASAAAAEALKTGVQKIITDLKAELKAKADGASKTATDGLDKLKTVLNDIPSAVKTALDSLCMNLPVADLQGKCKTAATDVVKAATTAIGQVCPKGAAELVKLGSAACAKAAEASSAVVAQASGFCTSATSAIPADTAKPLSEACLSITGELAKVPAEICDTAMKTVQTLADGACTAIVQAAAALKSLTRTALAAQKIRNRFAPAYARLMKLDSLEDFATKVKEAVEKAKNDLSKVKDEAMGKAATVIASTVADVVKKALVPVKDALSTAADAAVTAAQSGIGKITSGLAQIPTNVQKALTTACEKLPGGPGVVGECSTGVKTVVAKATEMLGKLCTDGVSSLIAEADKACTTASSTADNLLKGADGT